MATIAKNMPLAMTGETPALGCASCALYKSCGGLRLETKRNSVWDCLELCNDTCSRNDCDWVCLQKPDFWERALETGGFREASQYRLLPVRNHRPLPLYVPQITHGKSRARELPARIVAVPSFSALTGRGKRYGQSLHSKGAVREAFRLSATTEVLFVSVAPDRQLERYWRWRHDCGTPERLAKLGLWGMTLPNYSIFLNAPRTHWLFNRARMLYAGEELSRAGLPVVPHLNASSSVDWQFWEHLLKTHPDMTYVCKEFQTGLTRLDVGRRAIAAMARLQDRVGRDLHPIIVGGTRFLEDLVGRFRHFTLVDSNPFMAGMHRRRYELHSRKRIRRVANPTPIGAPLDDLVEENLRVYETWVYERAGLRRVPVPVTAELPAPMLSDEDEDEELNAVGAFGDVPRDLILT